MKKVVLIGAGDIGAQALKCLGAEIVEHFVDNHRTGQTYLEKPVFSMEKLVENREKYLFLLTIANTQYRDEFIDQLNLMGISDFYYFEQAIYSGNVLQKSDSAVYIRKSLYEDMMDINPERVCILGRERQIGRFVANLFEIENFHDETEQCSTSDLAKKYDYVFINVKYYSSKIHSQLKAADIKMCYIAHYYNCYNFLAKKGIKDFAGKYKEKKRCFVIGNGPSLIPEDLDALARHNEFCFGLNMIHKIYNKTKWRPNYICICDKLIVSQNLDRIFECNNCPVFLTDAVQLYFSPFQYDKAILYHEEYNRDDDYRIIKFETELSNGIIPSGWTVSYIAIQLAVYMGFDEVYLLGMDNSNWIKHCSDDYWSENPITNEASEELVTLVCRNAYKRVKAASAEYGFKIYNATRGGYLEEFVRVNFNELFN